MRMNLWEKNNSCKCPAHVRPIVLSMSDMMEMSKNKGFFMAIKIPTSLYLTRARRDYGDDLCFLVLALVSLSALAMAFHETQRDPFASVQSTVDYGGEIVQQAANLMMRGME